MRWKIKVDPQKKAAIIKMNLACHMVELLLEELIEYLYCTMGKTKHSMKIYCIMTLDLQVYDYL